MTELVGAASANPVVGPNKPGTIGIAYPGNAMRVVDIDDPTVVLGPGERNELMFRAPLVMDGYYGNDDATSASIGRDGWLHSGDIATMDDDGYFTIVDRNTDMILTAGSTSTPPNWNVSCACIPQLHWRRSREFPTRSRENSPRRMSS